MHPAILVGVGFLAGTVGMKALTSKTAHKVYVKGLVQGLKTKECCETMVEEAKAQFDDIMAEAQYEVSDSASAENSASGEDEKEANAAQ